MAFLNGVQFCLFVQEIKLTSAFSLHEFLSPDTKLVTPKIWNWKCSSCFLSNRFRGNFLSIFRTITVQTERALLKYNQVWFSILFLAMKKRIPLGKSVFKGLHQQDMKTNTILQFLSHNFSIGLSMLSNTMFHFIVCDCWSMNFRYELWLNIKYMKGILSTGSNTKGISKHSIPPNAANT